MRMGRRVHGGRWRCGGAEWNPCPRTRGSDWKPFRLMRCAGNEPLVRLLTKVQPNGWIGPAEQLGWDAASEQLGAAQSAPAEHGEC